MHSKYKRLNLMVLGVITVFSFNFVGLGETASTWYVGHYMAYCTSFG
jgi:hypothetical protein